MSKEVLESITEDTVTDTPCLDDAEEGIALAKNDEEYVLNLEDGDANAPLKEKKSAVSRLKLFFSKKKEQSDMQKAVETTKLTKKETSESIRKINDFLGTLENQLDKVDGQNKTLLDQLTKLKINNEMLIEQINVLTENNTQLTKEFNSIKKREKIAKVLAIISAILAISLSTYNILKLILQF